MKTRKLKPLIQSDYKMTIVKDLGMEYATSKSTQKRRFTLFECTNCNDTFRSQTNTAKRLNISICDNCRLNNLSNMFKDINTTHNKTNTRLYRIFQAMNTRCYNNKSKAYSTYGERGITICKEWLNDFMDFYNWSLANGYEDGLTIDRRENDLGYSPNNCRWVGYDVQAQNKSLLCSTNKSGYRGVCWHKATKKWIVQIQNDSKKIYLGLFLDKIDGAKAYDKYVIDNNLEHPTNFS